MNLRQCGNNGVTITDIFKYLKGYILLEQVSKKNLRRELTWQGEDEKL